VRRKSFAKAETVSANELRTSDGTDLSLQALFMARRRVSGWPTVLPPDPAFSRLALIRDLAAEPHKCSRVTRSRDRAIF
jgi:hypothetical protein